MDDEFTRKFKAGAKIAMGAGRMVSGVLTATGHGLVGSFLKSHHLMRQGMILAKHSIEGGKKQFDKGLEEWKNS
jgi:hypothetical protein